MIAVAVSLLFALYIIGPDAVSRFLLAFTIPRRSILLTRGEEISRALVWSAVCFTFAWYWARWTGAWALVWHPASAKLFFAGLYSEAVFRADPDGWFRSARDVFWMNWTLLWRLYAGVVLLSITLTLLTVYYGLVRTRLPGRLLRQLFTAVVLPRVAQWHVLLSKLLLADRTLVITLDVLTKSDKLYQGVLFDKGLAADGSLISVTLALPKRFDRLAYVKAKDSGTKPDSATFWKTIPTEMFVIMASDINTINIRHVPPSSRVGSLKADSPELRQLLETIADQVNRMRREEAGIEVTTSPAQPPSGIL